MATSRQNLPPSSARVASASVNLCYLLLMSVYYLYMFING